METEQKDIKFAARLVELRAKLPLRDAKIVPIKSVAEEAGVNIGSYSRAENGIVPGEKVLNRIAKYFNVSPDYLLHGNKENYSDQESPPRPIKDRNGLFGKTQRVQVDDQAFTVTTHEPDPANPYLQPMAMLSEILASQDPVLVPAIQANLRAFQIAIRREQQLSGQLNQLTEQSKKIKELKEECDEFKEKNDELEKRIAALEKRLGEPPEQECTADQRDSTQRAAM